MKEQKYIYLLEVVKESFTDQTAFSTLEAAKEFADDLGEFVWRDNGNGDLYYQDRRNNEYYITKVIFFE